MSDLLQSRTSPDRTPGLPNDELAIQVTDALVAAGLISPSKQEEVLKHLKAGSARAEDWRGWIESGWQEARNNVE